MNEQVKNNIMEYKQKYLQKLTDAQVPEKLEKQLEEMDWSCLELIHRKKQQRGTFAPLQAMLEKAKKANPATLVKICNSVVDDISTTLSLDQMVSLAKDVTKYKINSTTGFPTDLTTKNMPRCGDTVIPADLVTNVKKLHEYMFDDAAYTPSQTVQAISETIVNTTGITADSAKINTSDYNETVGATGTDEIQKGSETTGGTNVQ